MDGQVVPVGMQEAGSRAISLMPGVKEHTAAPCSRSLAAASAPASPRAQPTLCQLPALPNKQIANLRHISSSEPRSRAAGGQGAGAMALEFSSTSCASRASSHQHQARRHLAGSTRPSRLQRASRLRVAASASHTCRRCLSRFTADGNRRDSCRHHPALYSGGEVAKVRTDQDGQCLGAAVIASHRSIAARTCARWRYLPALLPPAGDRLCARQR